MRTGEEYTASLRDGRQVFLEGRQVHDVTEEPKFAGALRSIRDGYQRRSDEAVDASSLSFPRTVEDLRAQTMLAEDDDMTVWATDQCFLALMRVRDQLAAANPAYADRIDDFVKRCRAEDLRLAEGITDSKGDRGLPPGKQDDSEAYVRVVDRSPDGVYLSGAKLHVSLAPLVHEIFVMPTKRMKLGEEDYAIACSVPVNAPGLTLICSSIARSVEEDRGDFPASISKASPEAMVVLDRVFVPNDRIFLDGEVELSAAIVHSLGTWERLGSAAHDAHKADVLVGLSQLIAQANGIHRIPHIREKIGNMAAYATMIRAAIEASVSQSFTGEDGYQYPNDLYVNAAKFYAAAGYHQAVRDLHEIAGGAVVTAPSIADLENPETAEYVSRFMRGSSAFTGEERLRLFHLVRDLTADAYGGWLHVTSLQAGGGLFAQRMVTAKHYDMQAATEAVRKLARI